jgi:N-acetylneuraminic acid mutarotase
MHVGRIADTVTLLHDGRALVVGGLGPKLEPLTSAEIFDPGLSSWSMTANLPQSRFSHSTAVLGNGRVLVVGGIVDEAITRTTLLYDPLADRWTSGPETHFLHAQQSTVTLSDGRVLIAGGYGGGPEVYNPHSNSWSVVGPTPQRTHPVLLLLPNGNVLLATGTSARERDLRSAQLFDPRQGTWTRAGSLRTPRNAAVAAALSNGGVLVAGGEQVTEHVLRSAELYDPGSRIWHRAASMRAPRDAATATTLKDGTVLVCGGMNFEGVLAGCELYHP